MISLKVLVGGLSIVALASATCHTSSNDCVYEQQEEWSECDPCTKLQSREIEVITPPHFDGAPCPASQTEVRPCDPTSECQADMPCGSRFDCGIVGKCVDERLLCNGDDDCGNNADESPEQCKNAASLSRSQRECQGSPSVPYLDQLGQGIDITTGRIVGRVLDHERFNGMCRHAFDSGSTRARSYRMPFNIDDLRFAVNADNDIDQKVFRSAKDLLQGDLTDDGTRFEINFNIGADYNSSDGSSAGVGLTPRIELSFGRQNLETTSRVLKKLQQGNGRTMRFRNKVAIGQFVMRDKDLMLDPFFAKKIHELPKSYNSRSYFDFFNQFGTNYVHSGSLGGAYEEYYHVSDDAMRDLQMDERAMQNCVGFVVGANLGLDVDSFKIPDAGARFDQDTCTTSDGRAVLAREVIGNTTDKETNLMGGTARAAGEMMGAAIVMNRGKVERVKYESWVTSLKENPAVIDVTTRSVCDLFPYAEDKDHEAKRDNCAKAQGAFLRPYSTRNCLPCFNGGLQVNFKGVCSCACERGFTGERCEENNIPLKVPGSAMDRSLQMTDNLKLIVDDRESMMVEDPPVLNELPVGTFDTVLKTQQGRVLLLSSETGSYVFKNGQHVGGYAIKDFSEFLELQDVIDIDFNYIDDCKVEGTNCKVVDFDVDGAGNYIVSIKVRPVNSETYTVIHRLNREGRSEFKIDRPCSEFDESDESVSFVTALCDTGKQQKRIVVSCPVGVVATVKVYNNLGSVGLTQFNGYAPITSLQYFHNQLWFHTAKGQVGSFDLDTLEPKFSYNTEIASRVLPSTQFFVDFAKNLIVGQAENSPQAPAFTVVETETGRVLARALLPDWTDCAYVAAYRGKIFTKCYRKENAASPAILVFDYLK